MPRCCIGLGGNVGDAAATFRSALQRLARDGVSVMAVSRLYQTAPVGPDAGHAFYNACAIVETTCSPRELLHKLHEVEDVAGRTRTVRWGERTLDLDLLAFGDVMLEETDLTIPHPGVVYRRFVLDPLAEITPQLVHPATGRTIADLRQRLLARPLPLRLEFASDAIDLRIRRELTERWGAAIEIESDTESPLPDATVLSMQSQIRNAMLPGQVRAAERQVRAMLAAGGETHPIRVELDARLAAADPVAAAVAVVTAMLDEPQIVGSLAL